LREFLPAQTLWLGSKAVLSVEGTAVTQDDPLNGLSGSVLDAGEGCFLEFGDPRRAFTSDREAGSYAAYDLATRTIRTGLVIGGQAVAGCDLAIPIPRGS
jgi:hypothetical protein